VPFDVFYITFVLYDSRYVFRNQLQNDNTVVGWQENQATVVVGSYIVFYCC